MSTYTSDKPIWPGSSSFTVGDTPFGFFDNDTLFQQHADRFAEYAAQYLGYPTIDVELNDINFYTAFESAIIEYSNQVNQTNITNNLLNTLGIQTGSNIFDPDQGLTGANVGQSLNYITELSRAYGTEAGSGGNVKWHTASIDVVSGQQTYSIRDAVSSSLGVPLSNTSSIEIRRVIHNTPPAIVRYFDPFVGTGLGSQQLLDAFDFGGFSPSVNFMMMPIHQDLLRIQTIEFNDRIRKSHFTFEIHGDNLKIYPVPGTQGTAATPYFDKVHIEYLFKEEKAKDSVLFGNSAVMNDVISDSSNIPYTYQEYKSINDMGRAWIFKYAAEIAKETLGYVRSKYSSIPIPNSEIQLNGDTLLNQAQSAKENLITQLREFLKEMTKERMLERQKNENDYMFEVLSKVPLKIYTG